MSATPRFSRPVLAGVALVLAILAVYALALRGDFLWDDDLHITANPTIIGPLGLTEIWTTARANYFPLVLTNFWVQHALWGLAPLGYHAITLGFHALAAVLLWRVLRQLGVPGAWLGAALWALHPVQVESVAWICELKNTQSAVFFLLSIGAFLRWLARREGDGRAPVTAGYVLALLCALAALLSKPSTVMLPVALALCAWWKGARFDRSLLASLAPFLALSAIAGGWTIWEQKFHSGAIGAEWSQTWPERAALAGRVIWFYLGKLAWPWPLTFIYPRWTINAGSALAYAPLAAALAALVLLWCRADASRARAAWFGLAYFVALLFPVLGFFDVFFFRYSYVGDHFQYLASMGPLALLGAGITSLPSRARHLAAGALLVALGGMTLWQSRDYLDSETLWRATLARNPAATMAWVNLGDTLAQKARYDEAVACFERALLIKPGMADVYNDIGCTQVLTRRPADAVPNFERAIALQPRNPEAHNNLGNALRLLGRSDDAIAQYRQALAFRPDYGEAHNNLGAELAERGHPADALPHFEAALRANPKRADAHNNFGNALRQLGRLDEAMAQHQAAIALQPDFAEAYASLGQALLLAGKRDDALRQLRRAVELKPDFAPAHGFLGRALAVAGKPVESLAEFRRAVALAPDSPEARNNLGAALGQAGQRDEALVQLRAAVRLAPDFASGQLNLAMALAAGGEWLEAADHFQRAAELRPDSAETQVQLAVALVNADQLEKAVPHFTKALRLNPGAAEVHRNFAQVLQVLGRQREALEEFETADRLRRAP